MLEINPARIEVGVFDHLDDSGWELSRQYNDRLEIAAACDQSGFRGYHVAEHHGTPHGLAPAPNLLLSAIAQRTSTLRLGPMVMLLNLYHPLRAFEEICMLDQLSGGRLDLGIGRGATTFELGFFGVDPAVARERYQEAADIVLQAMTARRLDFHGRHFELDNIPITLSPVQRPHPPLWLGTTNPRTAAWAAEHGVNIVAIGPASKIRAITDIYRSRRPVVAPPGEAKPMLGMVRHVVVAESDREAIELARPAYTRWSSALTYLYRDRGAPVPPMLEVPFGDALDSGVCIAGSASTVRDSLLRQIDEAGVNYVMFLLAFGDLSLSASLRTIAGISAEIVPAIREMEVQWAPRVRDAERWRVTSA